MFTPSTFLERVKPKRTLFGGNILVWNSRRSLSSHYAQVRSEKLWTCRATEDVSSQWRQSTYSRQSNKQNKEKKTQNKTNNLSISIIQVAVQVLHHIAAIKPTQSYREWEINQAPQCKRLPFHNKSSTFLKISYSSFWVLETLATCLHKPLKWIHACF